MSLTTQTPQSTAPVDPAKAAEIRELSREHVFVSWSAQAKVSPLPLAGGLGARFWDYEGNSYLDFTSQLVNVNLGYQHPKMVEAVKAAADEIMTVAPSFSSGPRAEAARLISERAPERMNKVFFTNGGAEAVENAIRMARAHTGRHKILASYRSYHGATAGAIQATGEARRLGAEPGIPGVVHYWGPYLYRSTFHATTEAEEGERALAHLRQTVQVEGADRVAAIVLEPVVGSNGILVPPEGYLAGVRELCDEFGILMIADEVMAGFGRAGRWFSFQRWGVRPDLVTFAKGINSGYVPLGGVLLSDEVAASFEQTPYNGGLTYSGHALACATAVASVNIMEEEGVIEHAEQIGADVIGPALAELKDKHPVVGDVRGLAVFWAVELVADPETREPLAADKVAAVVQGCKDRGMWPLPMGNRIHLVPPCVITADEARAGIAALDDALTALGQ